MAIYIRRTPSRSLSVRFVLCVTLTAVPLGACAAGPQGLAAAGLSTGDCFRGDPQAYPRQVERIDCAGPIRLGQDYRVLDLTALTGEQFPSDFTHLHDQCRQRHGLTLTPSRATWK